MIEPIYIGFDTTGEEEKNASKMYQKRRKKINVYNALTVAKSHRAMIIMKMMTM